MQVTVSINGQEHTRDIEPRLLLVHFLRDEHRFDGTGLKVEKEVHEGDAANTILDVAE